MRDNRKGEGKVAFEWKGILDAVGLEGPDSKTADRRDLKCTLHDDKKRSAWFNTRTGWWTCETCKINMAATRYLTDFYGVDSDELASLMKEHQIGGNGPVVTKKVAEPKHNYDLSNGDEIAELLGTVINWALNNSQQLATLNGKMVEAVDELRQIKDILQGMSDK